MRGARLCHPRGTGEPSGALGDTSEWRRRKRRRKAAEVCRDLDIACSIAARSETAPARRPCARPAGQDLASGRGHGAGGTPPSWFYL